MRNWKDWHSQYDDANSSLTRRLGVVRRRLDEIVAGPAAPGRVLSLCSGDGRDLIPVLAGLPDGRRPDVVLVELDPMLAESADRHASALGVDVTVVQGDAGLVVTWRHAVPVDLLVLCGVFGNISDEDVHATIAALPALLSPGGWVVWTRGCSGGQDPRPQVRSWFTESGFREIAYDAEPIGFGVGVHQLTFERPASQLADRLFAFIR